MGGGSIFNVHDYFFKIFCCVDYFFFLIPCSNFFFPKIVGERGGGGGGVEGEKNFSGLKNFLKKSS